MKLIVLGAGYAGLTVARRARVRGYRVTVTTREAERARALETEGFTVVHAPQITSDVLPTSLHDAHIVATYPPHPETDAALSVWAKDAARVTRLSSTSVYGALEGTINQSTPCSTDARAQAQRAAEATWQAFATVLRCAAIYGRDRGVHTRILAGEWKTPGDGSRFVSRIHVHDLAAMILDVHAPGEALLAADLTPATHLEVAQFVCEAKGLPSPPFVPLEAVHPTLRGSRRVDASETHRLMHTALRYPSYREGLAFLQRT